MKARKAAKRGRPRKEGQREPSGRIRRISQKELEERTMAVVLEARKRVHRIKDDVASRPEAGYALGRLALAGAEHGVSRAQHEAGIKWGEVAIRYARQQGLMSPNARSPAFVMVARGIDGGDPFHDDEAVILATRNAYANAQRALMDGSPGHDRPTPIEVLRRVVIEDRPPMGERELGSLRIALNILARLYRVG
jgi:hypothetical protein